MEAPGTRSRCPSRQHDPTLFRIRSARRRAILKRRATLGPEAYVFGATHGAYQPMIQTGWETLKLLANGSELKAGAAGLKENQEHLRRIDLRWHDLRHEGACRLLADGVDIPSSN